MSKISESYLLEQLQEFELELSYNEWLMDNTTEPSGSELDEMEHDFSVKPYNICSVGWDRIITHSPLNNTNYNPMEEQL